MKNLNYVLLQPELGQWSKEGNAIVRDVSRPLGYFIGRHLKHRKVKSPTFSGIYFSGYQDVSEMVIKETPKFLVVPIILQENQFPFRGESKVINEFLISSLEYGLSRLEPKYKQLVLQIREAIVSFREAGYTCCWVHKTRKLPNLKATEVQLECSLDVLHFSLDLIIRTKTEVIFHHEILSTPPNEFCFKHRFKDIVIQGEECHITDFQNRKWASLHLHKPYQVKIHDVCATSSA